MLTFRISGFAELDNTKICYYKSGGIWYLYLPGCGLGNLTNHTVEEHKDGTISVDPSILVQGIVTRHGFLKNGIWTEV